PRPEPTRACAVAHAVRSAGRRYGRRALRGGRRRAAVRHVGACPRAGRERARLARPGAGLVAADALRAEAGVALGRRRTGGADRLQVADVRVADVGRHAIRVGRAPRLAGVGDRVAVVLAAWERRRGGARPRAVTVT